MDFVNFVMALSPILVVLVGILGFKQSAKRVSPIALVWTLILAFTYFNVTGASFADNVKTLDPLVWKGIKEGLKIVLMVFGAFTILNLLRETGAIDDVKSTIARISDDRRVQLIVIGMMLPIFLEGAAGAGAPAAIAVPFLVALGFDPVTSIAVALLGDDEFLNLQAVPLEELAHDVLAGRIPDAKTQAAILRVYCMEHGYEPK